MDSCIIVDVDIRCIGGKVVKSDVDGGWCFGSLGVVGVGWIGEVEFGCVVRCQRYGVVIFNRCFLEVGIINCSEKCWIDNAVGR